MVPGTDGEAAPDDDSDEPPPLVSVVVATYNRWPLVRETVASVLAQSFPDFEVVVVDDGSTDGTAENLKSHFPTVRVLTQANAERAVANNRAIAVARGRYVAFLDDDDLYEPWHLAEFDLARRRAPSARVFAGRAWMWDPVTGRRNLMPDFDPSTVARDAMRGCVVLPQAMVVERAALLEVGGFPEDRALIGSEDWVLIVKLTHHFRVHTLPRPSVLVREHPGRSMNNLKMISDSREEATRQILGRGLLGYQLDQESQRLLVAGTHRLTAAHCYGRGEMREARSSMREVRRTLGLGMGLRWTAKLWAQSWLGAGGSRAIRRLRQQVTWR